MAQDQGVFTNIDAFVKYINEHGETESGVIAANLGVSERNIEEWAKILENSKMAKITYKLGRMFIAPIGTREAATAESKQMGEVKRAVVNSELVAQTADVGRLMQRIDELNKAVAASENVLSNNAGTVREAIARINKLQGQAEGPFNQIKGRRDELEKFSKELEGMVNMLSGSSNAALAVTQNRNNANLAIEDLRSKIHAIEQATGDLVKNYDRTVKEEREKLIEFSKSTKSEIGALSELLKEEQKNLQQYDKTFKDYTNESARVRQNLEKNKTELLDRIAKTKSEIGAAYQAAEGEANKVGGILAKAREGLMGFEEMNSKIEGMKREIADEGRQVEELRAQLEALAQQFRAADAMGRQREAEKEALIDSVDNATKETAKKIEKADESMGNIKKEVDDLSKGE